MFERAIIAAADLSEAVKAMNRYSRRSGSIMDNWPIFAAFAAIVLFWAALHYWDRYRASRAGKSAAPQSLFDELCELHKLAKADRTLLAKAVAAQKLEQPAMAFVDPRVLARAGANGSEAAYDRLRTRLFGPLEQS